MQLCSKAAANVQYVWQTQGVQNPQLPVALYVCTLVNSDQQLLVGSGRGSGHIVSCQDGGVDLQGAEQHPNEQQPLWQIAKQCACFLQLECVQIYIRISLSIKSYW